MINKKCLLKAMVELAALSFAIFQSSLAFAACDPLKPNLRPLPASDISLILNSAGDPVELRFAATTWNSGQGRLEVIAKSVDTAASKQRVDQRIYDSCGGFEEYNAGSFDWHEGHHHFHFDGFANYFLTPVGTAGQGRNGSKTTFCIMDTTSINAQIWGASSQVYTTCGTLMQGMSVGWGDTYGSQLIGQSIDATELPPGDYALEINVDPFNRVLETVEDDNWSCTLLTFSSAPGSRYATSFNVKERKSSRCAEEIETTTITSISPNQVPSGWTGTVTIFGTGFDPVMGLSISSSSDSATVSKVLFVDSNTIQAIVKTPKKKRLRDPSMDIRVGSQFSYGRNATLPNAFMVTTP
jgi:hypothetical protein